MRRSTRTSTSQASRPWPDDSLADDDNPDGPTTVADTAAATGETVDLLEATPPRGRQGACSARYWDRTSGACGWPW